MFRQWISRILSVVFLLEVIFPAPVVRAAVPTTQSISQQLSSQVQSNSNKACEPDKTLTDERLRAADRFRQTDLAKEIVCRHQQGAKKNSGKGFAARGRRAAHQEAGPMQIQTEAISESTAIRRPIQPVPFTPRSSKPARPAAPRDPYSHQETRVGAGFKTVVTWRDQQGLFENWVITQLTSRLNSPDFEFGELIDFMDPYDPSGYDPVVTAVAAEALSIWFQSAMNITDEDVLEGLAFYASELEQRALYRLAFLENKSDIFNRSVNDIRAIGSLRLMLWNLAIFELKILYGHHKDIFYHYNNDSILTFGSKEKGGGLGQREFDKFISDIELLSANIKNDDPSSVSMQLQMTLNYAIPFGLLREKSGILIEEDGTHISKDAWPDLSMFMNRLDTLTKKLTPQERYTTMNDIPYGNYLQTSTLLYSMVAASLQQNLTEEDLQGARLTNLITLLKKAADVKTQTTSSVVTAVELASFLISAHQVNMSAADRQYFANALESIYCRSAIGHQDNLYKNVNGAWVQQNLGSSVSGLRNMAQLYFESFGFTDVEQHKQFMQGLAKMHRAFKTPRTVYKKVNPAVDHLLSWEEKLDGRTTTRKISQLPPGDFYYKCVLDDNYKGNDILKAKEVGRVMGAVLVEILTWVAFDGALRIIGKFVSPIFRTGIAGVKALPRAIKVAGRTARTGRMAGLAAGARELREAVVLANRVKKFQNQAGTITAVTNGGMKATTSVTEGQLALPGPGVTATSTPHALKVETVYEMVPALRPWTKWTDMYNRRLFGLGPARKEIEAVVLTQGKRTVTVNMRELGLENGIQTLGDWERMLSAAADNGFKFEPLTGAALRQARAEAYMTAQAAQKVSAQNWLSSHMPGATKYWKYEGAEKGWVQISQQEFMNLHSGLVRNQAHVSGVLSKKGNEVVENYYEILGVARTATDKEIQQAFRRQAILTHPDKGGNMEAMYKRVAEAYDVLRNPEKRAAFDRMLDLGGTAMLENEAGQSLAITLKGGVFDGSNGVAFGSASKDLSDVVGNVQKYMEDNGMFNPFRVNIAKLPSYWQGSYYSITRFLPAMYGADFLLQDHFRQSLSSQVESEQKEVLAPFQAGLEALEQKAKEQNLPPTLPSLYERVSSVEPLVGSWLGMPYLSFAGSSMGEVLYQTWHNVLEPFSPWKLHLINQDNRQMLRENASYMLANDAVMGAVQDQLKQESIEAAMKPLRQQYQESISQIRQQYGETFAKEADEYWKQFLQEIESVLNANKTEAEQQQEIERLNRQLALQLQRSATVAQVTAEKKSFMAAYASAPVAVQKQVEELYDRYIKEVTGIVSNLKLSDSKVGNLIEKAGKKLSEQLERLLKSLGMDAGSAAAAQAQDPGIYYELENIEDEADYFSYVYHNFLTTYMEIYPEEVRDPLVSLLEPALKRMDEIVASNELSEPQKRAQLQQIKKNVMLQASNILQSHEPDYLKQFYAVRSQMISSAVLYSDSCVASIQYMLDEQEQVFQALLPELETKTKERRQKKIQQFFNELQEKFVRLLNTAESAY